MATHALGRTYPIRWIGIRIEIEIGIPIPIQIPISTYQALHQIDDLDVHIHPEVKEVSGPG